VLSTILNYFIQLARKNEAVCWCETCPRKRLEAAKKRPEIGVLYVPQKRLTTATCFARGIRKDVYLILSTFYGRT
jgi:hypothetical protein